MSNYDTEKGLVPDAEGHSIWNRITDLEQIESIIEESADKPQLIYKHSPTCSVSFLAKEELDEVSEQISRKATLHMVDVIHQRAISNAIASRLGVRHESPQAIILKDGEVHWKGSHWAVKAEGILALFFPDDT